MPENIIDPFVQARKNIQSAAEQAASGYNPSNNNVADAPVEDSAGESPIYDSNSSDPTAGDVYGDLNYQTEEERAFIESQGQGFRDDANSVIDEDSIRNDTLSKFQTEIDALNKVYADKKLEEQIRGRGRMGQVGAIEARRGLLGSDFGVAQERGQEAANVQATDAIEDERALKVQGILGKVRETAAQEIKDKVEAKRLGAENYLIYIQNSAARKQKNVEQYAKELYASGTYSDELANEVAGQLGVSVEALKGTYDKYKREQDNAKALAEQEANEATEAESLERQESLLKEGYTYVSTPAQRDKLASEGYDITELAGRTYAKKPKMTTKNVKIGQTTYSITTDESGNVVKREPLGTAPSSGKETIGITKEQKQAILNNLQSVVGKDKKVSPDDYNAALDDWMKAGGNAKAFHTEMSGLRNPNNQDYGLTADVDKDKKTTTTMVNPDGTRTEIEKKP